MEISLEKSLAAEPLQHRAARIDARFIGRGCSRAGTRAHKLDAAEGDRSGPIERLSRSRVAPAIKARLGRPELEAQQ